MLVTESLLCCIASRIVASEKQLGSTCKVATNDKIETHEFGFYFFHGRITCFVLQTKIYEWKSKSSANASQHRDHF